MQNSTLASKNTIMPQAKRQRGMEAHEAKEQSEAEEALKRMQRKE